jgi:hypothetical protein
MHFLPYQNLCIKKKKNANNRNSNYFLLKHVTNNCSLIVEVLFYLQQSVFYLSQLNDFRISNQMKIAFNHMNFTCSLFMDFT